MICLAADGVVPVERGRHCAGWKGADDGGHEDAGLPL